MDPKSTSASLRHPDWLAEVQLVLAAGVVTATAAAVWDVVTTFTSGVDMRVPLPALEVSELSLPAGLTAPDWGAMDLTITDPSIAQRLWGLLAVVPGKVVLVAVAVLLFLAVRVARRDDPFAPGVVRRVRLSAAVALIGGLLVTVATPLAELALAVGVDAGGDGFSFAVSLSPVWIMAGVSLLAVAEILRRGKGLRDELAEVV